MKIHNMKEGKFIIVVMNFSIQIQLPTITFWKHSKFSPCGDPQDSSGIAVTSNANQAGISDSPQPRCDNKQ